jgi:hypothetical protein
MADAETVQKRTAAPYIAFPTFKTFLAPLKEHVIPNRIDKSLLKSFSGSVQPQLMTSLKFLHLIEDDGRPKEALRKLVSAFDTDDWAAELNTVLVGAYPELFQIPLGTVSPSEFNEAFKTAYPCEGETLSKGVRFFLSAANDAKVSFSPYLNKNGKPRSGPAPRRRVRGAGKNGQKDLGEAAGNSHAGRTPSDPPQPKQVEDPWLAKYPEFNPEWPPDIQKNWFAGYSELMGLRKRAKG